MKVCTEQLAFDFIYEWLWEDEQDREDAGRRNEDAIFRHMLEDHPVTEAEKLWLPAGIRLARHVHRAECHECDLDTCDHCQGWKWEQPVCLKDVRIEESRLGRELPVRIDYLESHRAPLADMEKRVLQAFPWDSHRLVTVEDLAGATGLTELELGPILGWLHIKGEVREHRNEFSRVRAIWR